MFKNTARRKESVSSKSIYIVFFILLLVSLSCKSLTPGQPAAVSSDVFSVEATSPVSVHIEWQAVPGASGYKLEGRYGSEFFPVADLPGDQTSYDHFVVPGSAQIAYRLRADDNEIGVVDVSLPELVPNPLVVHASLAGMVDMPGLDPNAIPSVDPGAIPDFDPNSIPGFDPSLLTPPAADSGASPDPSADFAPPYSAQEIGPEGGMLTATGLNGVIYTLTLSEGAVDQMTEIVLWPVQNIGGLPFNGGLLGAVQVWPQIPFNHPLTLTIELPETGVASPGIGFAVSSASNELFMIPARADSETTYTYRVNWGDTFGLASATPQEIRDQAVRIPTDFGAQMAQSIATLQSLSVDSEPQSEDALADQLLEGLLAQLDRIEARAPFETSVHDGVHPISFSPRDAGSANVQKSQAAQKLSQAIETAKGFWDQSVNAWNGPTNPASVEGVRNRLVDQIKAFVRQTELACLTEDAFYVTYLMNKLEWARTNAHPSQNFWAWLAEGYGPADTLRSCTFELEVTSTIRWEVPVPIGNLTMETAVHTPQPIKLKLGYREQSMFLYGVGPIQYDKYTYTLPGCTPFEAKPYPNASLWIIDLTAEFDQEGNLSDFILRVVKGDRLASETSGTGDIYSWGGCNPNINFTGVADFWTKAFTDSVALYRVYNMWEIGGSPPFFTATTSEFRRIPSPPGANHENTSLRLSLYGPDE